MQSDGSSKKIVRSTFFRHAIILCISKWKYITISSKSLLKKERPLMPPSNQIIPLGFDDSKKKILSHFVQLNVDCLKKKFTSAQMLLPFIPSENVFH